MTTKIQEKFRKFKSDLWEEQRFGDFAPIGSHVNNNEKKIVKNHKLKISKSQDSTFVRTTEKKIQKKKFEKKIQK